MAAHMRSSSDRDMAGEKTSRRLGPKTSPVGIFQGYDTMSGSGLTMAVTGEIESTGGIALESYRVCSGIQELSEALGVTQSLTASFGPIESISEKLEFASSLKVTTHSVCIVINAKHITGKETATNWHLNPDITPPQPGNNLELLKFFRVYGDSFLSSRTTGGEYYAVYTFYAETQERKSDVMAELQAKGLISVVSLDASIQAKLSTMSSTQTSRVSLDQIITGIANPNFPAADGIIQFALDFSSLPVSSPMLTDLETTGYERVPGIGIDFDAIAANRSVINDLQPKLVLLKQLQNDIDNISDIYSFYGGFADDTKLVQVKGAADEDVEALQKWMDAYNADPATALHTPELRSLANGTPSLRYEIWTTNSFKSGNNGEPYNDIGNMAYIQQKTRIRAFQCRLLNLVISYFKVTYENTQGSRVVEHGQNDGGELMEELLLEPGRVTITAVTGNLAEYNATGGRWRSVGLELSDGRQVFYGDYPEGLRWVVPKGAFLLGFSGRFGSAVLFEFQRVYASFRAAAWDR